MTALLVFGLLVSDWTFDAHAAAPRAVALAAEAPAGARGLARKGARYALLPLAGRKILVACAGTELWLDRNGDGELTPGEFVGKDRPELLLAIGSGGATRRVVLEVAVKDDKIVYAHRLRREGRLLLEGRVRRWALLDGNHDLRFDDARFDALLFDADGDDRLDPERERFGLDEWVHCRGNGYRFERGDPTGERLGLTGGEPRARREYPLGPGQEVEAYRAVVKGEAAALHKLFLWRNDEVFEFAVQWIGKRDAARQRAAAEVLGARGTTSDVKLLLRAGSAGGPSVRDACLAALRPLRESAAMAELSRAVRSKDARRSAFAMAVSAQLANPAIARALLRLRRASGQKGFGPALLNQSSKDVARALLDGFDGADVTVQRALLRRVFALGVRHAAVQAALGELLASAEWSHRALALLELRESGQNLPLPVASLLVERLRDPVWQVRLGAAEVLERSRLRAVVPPMIDALEREKNVRVRKALALSLYRITGVVRAAHGWDWRRWWDDEGERFVVALKRPPHHPPVKKKNTGERRSVTTFFGVPLNSSRVIFVIDASGSMQIEDRVGARSRFDVALDQLARAFRNLPSGAEANVIFFSDKVWKLKPRIAKVTPTMRNSIRKTLARHKPRGGTHLYDGIAAAFGDHRADTIILLSDGKPSGGRFSEPRQIEQAIRDWNALQRLTSHCVLIGYHSPNLQRVAEESGGVYVKR